mmetsp:Transcript_9860/g.24290  ORF Transcript_9860/g.24290 Transcript_9860/m.24290 type:complete len:216 (-) Transcript_9860:1208-1855(-)
MRPLFCSKTQTSNKMLSVSPSGFCMYDKCFTKTLLACLCMHLSRACASAEALGPTSSSMTLPVTLMPSLTLLMASKLSVKSATESQSIRLGNGSSTGAPSFGAIITGTQPPAIASNSRPLVTASPCGLMQTLLLLIPATACPTISCECCSKPLLGVIVFGTRRSVKLTKPWLRCSAKTASLPLPPNRREYVPAKKYQVSLCLFCISGSPGGVVSR